MNVVEFDDKLLFTNLGSFIPGSIQAVLQADSPWEKNRNRFLANAMGELKMVDTIGSGIKKCFAYRKVVFSRCRIMILEMVVCR
ncbi:MAG: hypothetical protein IJR01_05605 [Bacteroidales bacterium]|nr:hypothetical protein [Bacteroidales bacterium]